MTVEDRLGGDETGGDVMLVSETDSKHWEIVQAVADLHRQGYDTQAACKKLGIHRSLYYRAIRSPFVQEQRLMQIQAMSEASATIVSRNWTRVLNNVARIAHSGDDREAVAAARFLNEVRKDLERDAEREALAGDEFGDFMERFARTPAATSRSKAKSRIRARRTRSTPKGRVTEEVEVESEPFSGGNTIDVTP